MRIATIPMTYVTRAVEMGETAQILGCAVLGIEGGEIKHTLLERGASLNLS